MLHHRLSAPHGLIGGGKDDGRGAYVRTFNKDGVGSGRARPAIPIAHHSVVTDSPQPRTRNLHFLNDSLLLEKLGRIFLELFSP